MRRGFDIERAVGFALGRAYPWLLKVLPLPGGGMLWVRMHWELADAANDD